MKKRLDIQGLRALAAMGVLVFHATEFAPGGFLGVDVFFVVSGYIITTLTMQELRSTGRFDVGEFVWRRLRRLLPPMAIVLIFTMVGVTLIEAPRDMASEVSRAGFFSLIGLSNVYFYSAASDYFASYQFNPVLHYWSLSVEMQFYLAFALAAVLGLRLARTRRVALAAVTIMIVASAGLALWFAVAPASAPVPSPREFSFFMPFTRLWQFGLGALVALAGLGERIGDGRAGAWISGVALSVLVASFLLLDDRAILPGWTAWPPAAATAMLLAIGETRNSASQRLLAHPVLVYLGDRSYSIYLWQGPLIVFASLLFGTTAAILTAALLSLVFSAISYRHVERWALPRRRDAGAGSSRPRASGRVLLVYFLALAAMFAAQPIGDAAFGPAAPRAIRATELDASCPRQRGDGDFAPCVYGSGDRSLLLVGDSHAGALSQAVIDAAEDARWRALVAAGSACALPSHPETIAYRPSCRDYHQDVLAHVGSNDIDLVLLHQFTRFYVDRLGVDERQWSAALRDLVVALNRRGAKVLMIGDAPGARDNFAKPRWSRGWRMDLGPALDRQSDLSALEREAIAGVAGASYLAAHEIVCPEKECAVHAGEWLYTDADHLSVRGADLMREPLRAAIENAARELEK